jgi:hypothetical protein
MFSGDTATGQPISESDVNMISGTNLGETAETNLRRAVVTLAPKRRSKFVCETVAPVSQPVPIIPTFSRRPRMKRSGQMSLHWRNGSDEQRTNTVRISPEILSAFNKAIGPFGKSHAAA